MTRVAVVQVAPVLGDVAGNLARCEHAVADAVADGAQVVVLPELATCGYVFESRDEAWQAAITAQDPFFERVAGLLEHDAVAVVGFGQRCGGHVHNSAAVVSAGGVLGVYRKVHLWDRERLWFVPGDEEPLVVDTAHGRIGVMVCFDLEFPEWPRIAALRGAELLAVPTNWPALGPLVNGALPEVTIAAATARMNHMAVAFADRCGTERQVEWSQGSGVVDALGEVLALVGDGPGRAVAEVDLTASRDKRQGSVTDAFADRRPELYTALLAPAPATAVEAGQH